MEVIVLCSYSDWEGKEDERNRRRGKSIGDRSELDWIEDRGEGLMIDEKERRRKMVKGNMGEE